MHSKQLPSIHTPSQPCLVPLSSRPSEADPHKRGCYFPMCLESRWLLSGDVGQVTCTWLVTPPVSARNYPLVPRRAGKLSHSSEEIITELLTFLQHEGLPDTTQGHRQYYSWWVMFPSVILTPGLGHPVRSHLGLVKPRTAR